MDDRLAEYFLKTEAGDPPALRRAHVYRSLVRGSLRGAVEEDFPMTEEVLGADGFRALVDRFLDAGGPSTSFYRDVPADFVAWVQSIEHPYADLIQYEWLEVVAARHPADLDALEPIEEGLIRPNPTIQIGVYARPVHSISEETPSPEAFEAPMAYLIWRRPKTDEIESHQVGLLIASALAKAAEEPQTLSALAEHLEASGVDRAAALASLEAVSRELRARDGIL